ncbi:MAG: GNAT family N-acetyltransferase [bacterium]|nr:GNAT family N-acetyltransferase [bacterium]
MNIRQAQMQDMSAIGETDHIAQHDPERVNAIETWLQHDMVFVAENDDMIIGYGVFSHAFFGQGQIEMLMVHPNYRGKKVGEHLLKALEKHCESPTLFVMTNLSNQRMQRLLVRLNYRNCGFIEELDPGDPELIFVKKFKVASEHKTQ